MSKKIDRHVSLGTRQFVEFDIETDLGFVVHCEGIPCEFVVLVHPCEDDPNGVILWFDMRSIE